MIVEIELKNNILEPEIEQLKKQLSNNLNEDAKITISKNKNQIDSSYITLPSNIITAIAALLYVFIEGIKFFKKTKISYSMLIEEMQNCLAEKGAIDISIIEIANYKSVNDNKTMDPCIITVINNANEKIYKVFFYSDNTKFTIEVDTN